MKFRSVRFVASAFILRSGLSTAAAQSTPALEVPPVPANLQVPAGHTLFLGTSATGTQNYVCQTAAKHTVAWRFLGPQATLFVDGADGGAAADHHALPERESDRGVAGTADVAGLDRHQPRVGTGALVLHGSHLRRARCDPRGCCSRPRAPNWDRTAERS